MPNPNRNPTRKEISTFRQRLRGQASALLFPQYLNALDYRIYHYDRSADPARPEYNEHGIFVFWHEFISSILPRWGHTPVTVLCSKHRDGEIVNQTATALGLHIVRGSSNNGGTQAIRQLKKNAQFSSIVITPDGPRGPRREMAMGAIFLASVLRMPIVTMGVGISNPWRLKTWDQFSIPKPTSRVRVISGPKIHFEPSKDRDLMELRRSGIEKLLNDLSDQAQNWADSGLSVEGEQCFLRASRSNIRRFPIKSDSKGARESESLTPSLDNLFNIASQPQWPEKVRLPA